MMTAPRTEGCGVGSLLALDGLALSEAAFAGGAGSG
jgi:hypothetical protein